MGFRRQMLYFITIWFVFTYSGNLKCSSASANYADQQRKLSTGTKIYWVVRQLASNRQIIVLNGSDQMPPRHISANLTGLMVPAAALGAVGCVYKWLKGKKFSDLMYVTKRSKANAVTNLTKHLEQVSETLADANTHLTQRIQHLDDKIDSQKEISKAIQNDVNVVAESFDQIGSELCQLKRLVCVLDGKIGSLEEKQDIANMGVLYLCKVFSGENVIMPKILEDQLKLSGRARSSLTYSVQNAPNQNNPNHGQRKFTNQFDLIPMTYTELLPQLVHHHLLSLAPYKSVQPPYPRGYDPNAKCEYHSGARGHSTERCLALKSRVQGLIKTGWLSFEPESKGPNNAEPSHKIEGTSKAVTS